MHLLTLLFVLASAQIITSEVSTDTATAITNADVAVKNKVTPKSDIKQPTAVATPVKAKSPTVEIKPYDDGLLKWNISDLNKRQSQQENFLKQLLESMSYIKKTLARAVSQNIDWTVILRRQDGSVDFFRTWDEYKEGFGNPQGEFFIGLDNLHEMTSGDDEQELLIYMEDFENQSRFAKYDKFKVGSEDDKYAIQELGDYHGDAGDSLSYHRTRKFSTKDQDNDNNPTSNCALDYKAGWWFDNCYSSNLNGPYYKGARSCRGGINWYHWHNYVYSLKFVEMMIRNAPSDGE